jgi:hypothetical protein
MTTTVDVAVTSVGRMLGINGLFANLNYITIILTEDGTIRICGKKAPQKDTDWYLGVPQVDKDQGAADEYLIDESGGFVLDEDTAEALGTALLSFAQAYGPD